MSLARYRPQGQPQQKIRPEHLDRAAVVYVRQSSRQQVLEHSESTRLQYALAERAVALGWARSQVMVIDDDLGVSAATADSRKGFARLVTEVTMGRAGVVLGIEMSRLARTGRDWHQLLELCSLSGVLLADPDGVYDPGVYNDRLLLGLKGTMSEAELYLIRQRMLSGKLAKAERGELAIPLPIGYVRRPSGEAVLDPDEQAQHVVRLVFGAFRAAGDPQRGAALPGRAGGPAAGPGAFRAVEGGARVAAPDPGDAADHAAQPGLRRVLRLRPPPGRAAPEGTGPAQHRAGGEGQRRVAGAAAGPAAGLHHRGGVRGEHRPDGRQPADRRHAGRAAGRRGAAVRAAALRPLRRAPHDGPLPRRIRVPRGPRTATRAPSTRSTTGPAGAASTSPAPRSTPSRPARCWRRWRRPRWRSPWPPPPRPRTSGPCWTSCGASGSSAPATPPTAPAASTSSPSRRTGSSPGSWKPDWEAALAETARLEADYQRFTEEQPAALTAAERAAIQALASDLPRVWDAPSTTQADRKELLRILIEDITVTVAGDSELVDVTITWAGGHQTTGQAVRPVARLDQLSYYPALLARVTELAAAGRNNRQIADTLNAEGFRPPKRTSRFTGGQVRTLITQRGIRGQPKGRPAVLTSLAPGEWSVPGLAAELGMPTATIYNWIYRGWITARHAPGTRNWIITADDEQMRQLRERRARPPGFYARARWAPPEHEHDDRQGTQP